MHPKKGVGKQYNRYLHYLLFIASTTSELRIGYVLVDHGLRLEIVVEASIG
jgi:hypothetical protein